MLTNEELGLIYLLLPPEVADSLISHHRELKAQTAARLDALKAWEHWYSVDSTEFNCDSARDKGLAILESAAAESPEAKPGQVKKGVVDSEK